jgi:hypothetical protein
MTLAHVLIGVREAQVPLLSAMLLGGCAAKLTRTLRVGSVDAGLGPTALFPLRLRRPVAVVIAAVELVCGVALILTAGGLGRGDVANAVRLTTSLLFLVATCALIELRTSHPETGCGCFGEFSKTPVSGRTLARSAFFAVAALGTIGLPPLRAPHPGADAARLLGILAIELCLIAALSPELGETLVRLGYSEPCELRRLPAVRTLAALRRSSQWRRRAGLITAEVPVDMWRELCWRYVVFPARVGDRDAEIVFAVYLRPNRPVIHAALVDSASGEVLPWPASPTRRAARGRPATAKSAPPRTLARSRARVPAGMLAAPAASADPARLADLAGLVDPGHPGPDIPMAGTESADQFELTFPERSGAGGSLAESANPESAYSESGGLGSGPPGAPRIAPGDLPLSSDL